jgi:hypothetical protein
MLMPLLFLNGAWIASEAARELCADIEEARVLAKMTRAEMASKMKLGEPPHGEKRLSDQLTLKHPMNIGRLADLPLTWWGQFLLVRSRRCAVQVIEDVRIADVMLAVQRMESWMKRVEARMLKMELSTDDERRVG